MTPQVFRDVYYTRARPIRTACPLMTGYRSRYKSARSGATRIAGKGSMRPSQAERPEDPQDTVSTAKASIQNP